MATNRRTSRTKTQPTVETTTVEETTVDQTTQETPQVESVDTSVTEPTLDEMVAGINETTQAPVQETPVKTQEIAEGVIVTTKNKEQEAVVTPKPTIEGFLEKKYQIKDGYYSQRLAATVAGLKDYIAKMGLGKVVNPSDGVKYQTTLLKIIRGALDADDVAEANVCFDTVLFAAYLHANEVFNDRMLARFTRDMHPTDRDAFLLFSNLLVNTADPRYRAKGLKGINLAQTVARLRNERLGRNLIQYYNHTV